jgi:hypothetical protein
MNEVRSLQLSVRHQDVKISKKKLSPVSVQWTSGLAIADGRGLKLKASRIRDSGNHFRLEARMAGKTERSDGKRPIADGRKLRAKMSLSELGTGCPKIGHLRRKLGPLLLLTP